MHIRAILFKTYCLCFYDIALWTSFNVYSLKKFRSCYNRCAKLFFGFKRQDSLTEMLLLCGIPSFETVVYNSKFAFQKCLDKCVNVLVNCYRYCVFICWLWVVVIRLLVYLHCLGLLYILCFVCVSGPCRLSLSSK